MKSYRNSLLISILVLATISLACSLFGVPVVPATTVSPLLPEQPEATIIIQPEPPVTDRVPTSTVPEPTHTPDPTADCPNPMDGKTVYTSESLGYCLRFPAAFTPTLTTENGYEVLVLAGPFEPDSPKSMERMQLTLRIARNGPALGLDSNAYATKWVQLFTSNEKLQPQPFKLGAQPAVLITGVPGYTPVQMLFVVANGTKYTLTLQPQLGDIASLDEQARNLWEDVINSLVFIPPTDERSFILPDEVCFAESAGHRLYINEMDGYCLLYPEDFQPDPDFPGAFEGGPVLGDYQGFQDVQTSITVGTFGDFPGSTIREAMAARLEFSDTPSIQDTTIAGYPAITYRHLAGPWASRDADVIVNGRVYTILGQPWEPERWPDGIPYLDRLWESVIGSIQFFDPWR